MAARPTISTHVLDTATGQPAAGVVVHLLRVTDSGVDLVAAGITNADGRISDMLPNGLAVGLYRIEFEIGQYRRHATGADDAFFERISLDLNIVDTTRSYHVPLLLAPYGCTAYRGS